MSDELTQKKQDGSRKDIPDGYGFKAGNSSSDEQRDLVDEMNQEFGSNTKDPFKKEIEWGEPESNGEQEPESDDNEDTASEAEQQEETSEDETAGEETQQQEEDSELEGSSEETDEEESEQVETTGEEETEEEPEEPETFYDATRDFPDMDIDPTTYKDRVDLNEGYAAKVRYLSELRDQLQERDAGLGAIQLPELFGNSEDFLDQPADREMFASQEDDKAKKTVAELDRAIKLTKGKIDRIDHQIQQKQQKQEVSKEFKQAVNDLVQAVDAFGIDRGQAERMSPQELLQQADKAIDEYVNGEKGEDLATSQGPKAVIDKVDELRSHRQSIEKFPQAWEKHQKVQDESDDSGSRTNKIASPEQIEDWFGEFRSDNPDLDMFTSPTYEPEKAFRDYVNSRIQRDGFKIQGPRDFITLHKDYKNMLQKQSERYGKSKASTEKATSKSKQAGEERVDKSEKKKPPVHKIKDKSQPGQGGITTQDIDKEFEQLASELNNAT